MPVPGRLGRLPFSPERPHLVLERYLDPRRTLAVPRLPPVSLTASLPLNHPSGDQGRKH